MKAINENALVIINASILTMTGVYYDKGYVCISDGRIESIGDMCIFSQCMDVPRAEILDVNGMVVMPGFIDCHSHIGLIEEGAGFIGDDANEIGQFVSSHLRVIDGINPMDRAFLNARENGITTVAVAPGDKNIIGG